MKSFDKKISGLLTNKSVKFDPIAYIITYYSLLHFSPKHITGFAHKNHNLPCYE